MVERLLPAVALLAVLGIGGALWLALDAPVQRFVVSGDLTASEQATIEDILGREEMPGLLSVDLARVVARLEDLHWARDIAVRRQWPDTLAITLTREKPLARWGDGQYVSASGHLLELPDEHPGVPRFDVALSSPAQAMKIFRLLDQLADRMGLSIALLKQDAQGGWLIETRSGLQVYLGADRLSERMDRFGFVYREVLKESDQPVAYVDARYTSGVAVGYEEDVAEDVLVAGYR